MMLGQYLSSTLRGCALLRVFGLNFGFEYFRGLCVIRFPRHRFWSSLLPGLLFRWYFGITIQPTTWKGTPCLFKYLNGYCYFFYSNKSIINLYLFKYSYHPYSNKSIISIQTNQLSLFKQSNYWLQNISLSIQTKQLSISKHLFTQTKQT